METQVFDKNLNLISERKTKVPFKAKATYIRIKKLKDKEDRPKSEVITNLSL